MYKHCSHNLFLRLAFSHQITHTQLVDIPKYTRQAFNIFVVTDDMDTYYPTIRAYYGSGGRYAVMKEDSYLKVEAGSGNRCSSGFCGISTPIVSCCQYFIICLLLITVFLPTTHSHIIKYLQLPTHDRLSVAPSTTLPLMTPRLFLQPSAVCVSRNLPSFGSSCNRFNFLFLCISII